MATMAQGLVEKTGKIHVSMPSGFHPELQPSPQPAAEVDRYEYKAEWHEAMKVDGHKTTRNFEALRPSQGRNK